MKERFYSKHFHCYQYDIFDSFIQDEYGDKHIGTANGSDDAEMICKELNRLSKKQELLENENKELVKDNKILLKHCENHGIIVPLNYERYKQYVGW